MSSVKTLNVIVVGTDFSEDATSALSWATQLARQHGARLLLVHALTSDALPAPEFVPLPPEYNEAIHSDAKRRLEEAASVARKAGVDVEHELILSSPSNGILDVAQRRGADLIVAGTRGRSGWKRALLGSTAARLVRRATCPVMTVRHDDDASPRAIRTIVVPTDFSKDADVAVATAAEIVGKSGADRRLVLVHAYRIPIEAAHLPSHVLQEAIRETERAAHDGLEKLAERLRQTGLRIEIAAREGDPTQVILELADLVRCDLIAIGTHGRSGLEHLLLGSTAERVLSSAQCPVLTVHQPEDN
jgi:nucleotide-binding universal stress UspA family protein